MSNQTQLTDLSHHSPQDYDRVIVEELVAAGLRPKKFREYDSPNYCVKHTLKGEVGDWALSRDKKCWNLWCKVPLSSAEVIASSDACTAGSIPKQWFTGWGAMPKPNEIHTLESLPTFVTWVTGETTLLKDIGYHQEHKEAIIDDGGHSLARKIQFVDDPEALGKPYIMNYTFFTLEALVTFMRVIRRHRLLPQSLFMEAAA